MHELDAVIYVRLGCLQLPGRRVSLRRDPKGLSVVDLSELLCHAPAECLQATDHHHFAAVSEHAVTATCSKQQPTSQPDCPQPEDQQPQSVTAQLRHTRASQQHAGPEPQGCPQASGDSGGVNGSSGPRRPLVGARRCYTGREPDQPAALPDDGLCSTSQCGVPARMGAGVLAIGQAPSPHFRSSLPQGYAVCSIHGQENHADQRAGPIFPKFRHREVQSACQGQDAEGAIRPGEQGRRHESRPHPEGVDHQADPGG